MQDALGFISDQVNCWRLLLEEYGPTIMYIKGIHNMAVDSISHLDSAPVTNDRATWTTVIQCWCHYIITMHDEGTSLANYEETMNLLFANRSKENAVYPLTVREIAESQSADITMGQLKNQPGSLVQMVRNTMIL